MTEARPSYTELQGQLEEAREVIRALRSGEVDAIISERDVALVRLRDTEEALRRLNLELEQRVRERTGQLEEANRRLQEAMSALQATHARLLELERTSALAALAAVVAHEVNSPLMGVLNAVAYVRRHEREPELFMALQDADAGLRHIGAIMRNLLTFAGPPTRFDVSADVAAVMQRALNLLQPDLQAHEVEVSSQIPADLPAVAGDETRLQQVFGNLLTNARDAVATAPARRVVVRAHAEDGAVLLEVEDTGPGIAAESREQIFEPFYTTKPGAGTGLGLPVARAIVEDLGGKLTLESPPGQGARFRVRLPLAREENG